MAHRKRRSGGRTAQQRKLAAASRACKGTGPIGGSKRNACLRRHLSK